VAFREACAHDEHCARTWTLYGVSCVELGRLEDAQAAFDHALWLRQQANQVGRAEVLQTLMTRYGLHRQCA
jgi:Flp pilus assembly protein TadD